MRLSTPSPLGRDRGGADSDHHRALDGRLQRESIGEAILERVRALGSTSPRAIRSPYRGRALDRTGRPRRWRGDRRFIGRREVTHERANSHHPPRTAWTRSASCGRSTRGIVTWTSGSTPRSTARPTRCLQERRHPAAGPDPGADGRHWKARSATAHRPSPPPNSHDDRHPRAPGDRGPGRVLRGVRRRHPGARCWGTPSRGRAGDRAWHGDPGPKPRLPVGVPVGGPLAIPRPARSGAPQARLVDALPPLSTHGRRAQGRPRAQASPAHRPPPAAATPARVRLGYPASGLHTVDGQDLPADLSGSERLTVNIDVEQAFFRLLICLPVSGPTHPVLGLPDGEGPSGGGEMKNRISAFCPAVLCWHCLLL